MSQLLNSSGMTNIIHVDRYTCVVFKETTLKQNVSRFAKYVCCSGMMYVIIY